MAEIASLVITVIQKLKEPILKEGNLLYGVAGKVDSVREKLEWINAFLTDAEATCNQNETFKIWVEKVRDVAYRIEDAIDIYVVQIKGVRTLHSGFLARLRRGLIKKVVALHKLGMELRDIEGTLEDIKKSKEMFQINDCGAPIKPSGSVGRSLSLGYLTETTVGLENEKQTIIAKLLDPQAPALWIVSIVGTGGLGKTTLAHNIFNSADVKQNFDLRIWLSVSQEPNRLSILNKMLQKIHGKKQEGKDEDEMYFVQKIKSSLKKKRFLIVLDDVWPETPLPDISMLHPPDNEMDLGRILITTRDLDVAQKAKSEPYNLRFLTEEESKMLLYKSAFPRQEPPQGLEDVATEIAKGCGGLPLALVVVGGSLYMKRKYSEWRKVADSMVWRGSECMNVLALSYNNMPKILKTCFMYLACFPEDYRIDAKSLVQTWVAEDFVADEETAENCLQELVQRCLIIVRETSFDDSVKSFCVHGLLLELAIKKANEQKFILICRKQKQGKIGFNNARRASLQSCSLEQSNNNSLNTRKVRRNSNEKVRSLLVFNEYIPDSLSRLKLLKVLKLHDCHNIRFSKLEKWCEELIHLRHLEFRRCKIENDKIPESIGYLKNLLTLDCSDTSIKEMPDSLWRITTLRHVVCQSYFDDMAKSSPISADLPNLKTLWYVKLGPPRHVNPCYHFPKLRDLALQYTGPWVTTLLKDLHQLVSLEIQGRYELSKLQYDLGTDEFPMSVDVLDALDKSGNQSLPLDEVVDMRAFPFYNNLQCLLFLGGWPEHVALGAQLFPPNLAKLELAYCNLKEDPMPVLEELKNLVVLELVHCRYTGEKTLTSSGGCLPQLQRLTLTGNFKTVEEFIVVPGAMPMLKELIMRGFLGIKNIPNLQHLKMLRQFEWLGAPCWTT